MRRLCSAIVIFSLALSSFCATFDLGDSIIYVRRGFSREWISEKIAAGTGDWKAIPSTLGQDYSVRGLGLFDDDGGRVDLFRRSPESFTYAITFDAALELIYTTGLSILLPQVGQGWALYINGELIRNEIDLDSSGHLKRERALRGLIVPIDKRFIREGTNILAFHIFGDPGDERTGISGSDPFVIDAFARLAQRDKEYIDLLLIGIYAFFALYHLVLFAFRPANRSYLLYGLGAIVLSLFVFARTATATSLVSDTAILRYFDHVMLFAVIQIFLVFFEILLRGRVSLFSRIALGLGLLLGLLQVAFRSELLHEIWEIGAAVFFVWLLAATFTPRLLSDYRGGGDDPGKRIRSILRSDATRLLPGVLILIAAAMADIFTVNSGGSMFWSKYAFLLLVLGAATVLADQFVRVYGQLEGLSVALERKVLERSSEIEASLERQKELAANLQKSNRELGDAAEAADRDLLIAERVQRGFFPARPPNVEGWDLALAFKPAAGVSGDFYDFYANGAKLEGIVIGDVSGHGVGSGLVSVLARSVFARRFAEFGDKALGECMAALNEELVGELGAVDEYLTALMLRIAGNRIEYVNSAHPDLLFRKARSGKALALSPKGRSDFRGPPLGKEGFEDAVWKGLRFSLDSGDLIVAYTDCLEDAKNSEGERYGFERLAASLSKAPAGPAQAVLDALQADLARFVGGHQYGDDLCVIVLMRREAVPSREPDASRSEKKESLEAHYAASEALASVVPEGSMA